MLCLLAALAHAESSPAGVWRVMGDDGLEAEALVRITERDGVFEGRIVHLVPRPGIAPDARCELCPGNRRGAPVLGMTILSGVRRVSDEYRGGTILDPESGDEYRCVLRLSPDGRRLTVRGYVGIAMFGRSQVWQREGSP